MSEKWVGKCKSLEIIRGGSGVVNILFYNINKC